MDVGVGVAVVGVAAAGTDRATGAASRDVVSPVADLRGADLASMALLAADSTVVEVFTVVGVSMAAVDFMVEEASTAVVADTAAATAKAM